MPNRKERTEDVMLERGKIAPHLEVLPELIAAATSPDEKARLEAELEMWHSRFIATENALLALSSPLSL